MRNFIKYLIAFAAVGGALAYLMISGVSGEKIYYREVSELLSDPKSALSKGLRVSGNVTEIYAVDPMRKTARFEVADSAKKEAVIEVVYTGTIPDAFETGAAVVVEGTFDDAANRFTASKLLAKCPSKYEAETPTGEHPAEIPKAAAVKTK